MDLYFKNFVFIEFDTMHWVYVIACEDDVLYVGETTQLDCARTSKDKDPRELTATKRIHTFINSWSNRVRCGWYNDSSIKQLIRVRNNNAGKIADRSYNSSLRLCKRRF